MSMSSMSMSIYNLVLVTTILVIVVYLISIRKKYERHSKFAQTQKSRLMHTKQQRSTTRQTKRLPSNKTSDYKKTTTITTTTNETRRDETSTGIGQRLTDTTLQKVRELWRTVRLRYEFWKITND